MKNPILVGLVGEKGSGKETVGQLFIQLLPEKKIAHVKFSDLLKETLDLWSLPLTRTNLQDLAIIMDQHFGEGTLAYAMKQRIKKLDADIVILDGVRWDADIKLINSFKKHFLIYVTAEIKTRFKRISKRVEKVGEGKNYEQFLKEEEKPNEVGIPRLGSNADFKIENNTSISNLTEQLKKFIKTKFKLSSIG
jgi:dephospho-CoA kinase